MWILLEDFHQCIWAGNIVHYLFQQYCIILWFCSSPIIYTVPYDASELAQTLDHNYKHHTRMQNSALSSSTPSCSTILMNSSICCIHVALITTYPSISCGFLQYNLWTTTWRGSSHLATSFFIPTYQSNQKTFRLFFIRGPTTKHISPKAPIATCSSDTAYSLAESNSTICRISHTRKPSNHLRMIWSTTQTFASPSLAISSSLHEIILLHPDLLC